MTQLEETQAGIIERERAAISKLGDLYAALQAKNAELYAELTTACQLIGQVRQLVAFGRPYLEIANVIDAWMNLEPPTP